MTVYFVSMGESAVTSILSMKLASSKGQSRSTTNPKPKTNRYFINSYGRTLLAKTNSQFTTSNTTTLERNKYIPPYDRIINLLKKELIYFVLKMIYRRSFGVESPLWRDSR